MQLVICDDYIDRYFRRYGFERCLNHLSNMSYDAWDYMYEKYIKPDLKFLLFLDIGINVLIYKYGTIKTKELLKDVMPMTASKDRMKDCESVQVTTDIIHSSEDDPELDSYSFSEEDEVPDDRRAMLLVPSYCKITFDVLEKDNTADLVFVKACWRYQDRLLEILSCYGEDKETYEAILRANRGIYEKKNHFGEIEIDREKRDKDIATYINYMKQLFPDMLIAQMM